MAQGDRTKTDRLSRPSMLARSGWGQRPSRGTSAQGKWGSLGEGRTASSARRVLHSRVLPPVQDGRLTKRAYLMPLLLWLALSIGVGSRLLYLRLVSAPELAAGTWRVEEVQGHVEVVSDVKDWIAKRGEVLEPGVRLRCDEKATVTLRAAARGTLITVLDESEMALRSVQQASDGDFKTDCEVLRGEAVFDFRNEDGLGFVHVQTPQGVDYWGRGVLFRVKSDATSSRMVTADGLVKATAGEKKVLVPSDTELRSTFEAPLGTPRRVNIIRMRWKA